MKSVRDAAVIRLRFPSFTFPTKDVDAGSEGQSGLRQFDKWRHLPAGENHRGWKRGEERENEMKMKGEQERAAGGLMMSGEENGLLFQPPIRPIRLIRQPASCLLSIYSSNKNAV